jgi:hypothetical protein
MGMPVGLEPTTRGYAERCDQVVVGRVLTACVAQVVEVKPSRQISRCHLGDPAHRDAPVPPPGGRALRTSEDQVQIRRANGCHVPTQLFDELRRRREPARRLEAATRRPAEFVVGTLDDSRWVYRAPTLAL